MSSTNKDYSEAIIQNNSEIKIDTVKLGIEKKKKNKHASFFIDPVDYMKDSDRNKVVCVKCTKQFFDIFFPDADIENDPVMKEIFKSKKYMDYIPKEEIYRCGKCGAVELPRDPQISKSKEKKILAAGIENFPEYVSYLNPDSIKSDYIGTANRSRKKKTFKDVYHEETEEERFLRYLKRN